MRALAISLIALALVGAGCTSTTGAISRTAAPSPVPTPAVTQVPSPTAAPTPTPRPVPTEVSARITFDGSKCVYTGPTVIPFPANLTLDYAPTAAQAASWIGIFAVHSGTTQADLDNPANPDIGVETPTFVYFDTAWFSQGPGRGAYRSGVTGFNPLAIHGPNGKPYAKFVVLCVPTVPGKAAGGSTFLHVVESGT